MKVKVYKIFLFLLLLFFVHAKLVCAGGVIVADDIIKIANDKKLYEDRGWLNLLHYEGKESVVDKKSSFFFSSKGYKNPQQEMVETIKAFFAKNNNGDAHPICSFPARFDFILQNTGFAKENFSKPNCQGYEEFRNKAPLDKAFLVFASENNSTPNSIMGHIFVKISGTVDGKLKEHALSYFATDFDENSIKTYLDVVFSSVDGVYALSPYEQKRNHYLFFEQRVIWEVELKLSSEQKTLLHKHMWELKEKNVRYSFVFHNCGTASINLFKLVYEDLDINKFLPTPIDYVKKIEQNKDIEDVSLIPSPEYNLKMLRDNYDVVDLYKVRSQSTELDDKQKYLANLLHNYYESFGMIDNNIYKNIDIEKLNLKRKTKNILDAKPSSRLYVGYKNLDKDALEINFMPLYQSLLDVSKAHFDDFETKIAAINFVYDDKAYINKIDIFTAKSLVDASMGWKMLSKDIKFALENSLGEEGFNLKPVVEGGVGYSFAFFDHRLNPYIMPKIGYRYDEVNNFYFAPEYGVILKPVDDIKIIGSYQKYFNSKTNNRGFDEKISITLSYELPKNMMINVGYDKYCATSTESNEEFNIGLGINF